MPELLLELFSEEIPARMQARAAADLGRLVADALATLSPANSRTFHGPRRIALAATVNPGVPAASITERGPRSTAPEQALAGFLRKHGATRDALVQEGDYWVLHKQTAGQDAATLIAAALPPLLRRFPWPKSMRWGGTGSLFTWVRPLRRILCILDGATVPFTLADGSDDGHGLRSGNETEGHRFMAPGPFPVRSASEWQAGLLAQRVMADAAHRRQHIADGVHALAAAQGLTVVDDPALLDEVAGLVEWPVPLLGRIDPAFMDLPPEVLQVSMRVNQRYFALRHADGSAAPVFAFAANIEAPDGGATIIAGNERVLRARFGDARYFWDADRKTRLADRVTALDGVTFHAKLGSQGARVHRIVQLAEAIAPRVGADPALAVYAARAALLAKADLTTGMVGEFPELQGTIGRYYALHDEEHPAVADAVRDHYAPRGPSDETPSAPLTIAVALADKIDTLTGFFSVGELPTGSRDPFALRRAGTGLVRIINHNRLSFGLTDALDLSKELYGHFKTTMWDSILYDFIVERIEQAVTGIGANARCIKAVTRRQGQTIRYADILTIIDNIVLLTGFMASAEGEKVLAAYRRARNIVRIENSRDNLNNREPSSIDPRGSLDDAAMTAVDAEFYQALFAYRGAIDSAGGFASFAVELKAVAGLSGPIDRFFEVAMINDPNPAVRSNRLRLLFALCTDMERVTDFSAVIEG